MKTRSYFLSVLLIALTAAAFARPAQAQPLSIDLEGAMELALESDRSVKAAEADVAKANEERRQAHKSRAVTVRIEHDSARVNQYQSNIDASSFQNVVSAAYSLYTGGRIEGAIAAAEYELRSRVLGLERARQDVRLAVAVAFFTMLRTGDMAELAADSVERLNAHVRYVDAQYRNGRVGKADLLSSQVDLLGARGAMEQAVSEYRVAMKSLNDVMGLPLDTELSHAGEMSRAAFLRTLDECLSLALASHPNLEIAGLQEKKAEAGIAVERSAAKPQVTLALRQSLGSPHNWPGFEQEELQTALHAEYTLSDGGLTASRVRGAREDLRKAGYNRESVRDSIVLDVTRYFMAMEESGARIETAAEAVGIAEEAYRIALVRYREGVGTNLDVLDAQDALHQSESRHTQALCDYNIAAARTLNAAGASASAGEVPRQ